jgi:hypothetical protein
MACYVTEYFAEIEETQYTAEIESDEYAADITEAVQIIDGRYQDIEVTATQEVQQIEPDAGYTGFSRVVVNPIPQNYGLITWNGAVLTVS